MTAIRSEMAASLVMVRYAAREQASRSGNWLSWLVLAFAVLIPATIIVRTGEWIFAIGIGAGVPLMVLALLWWTVLLASLAEQYQGYNRLVPGMRARARRVLLLVALAMVLVLGTLFTMAGAAPDKAFAGALLVLSVWSLMLLLVPVFPKTFVACLVAFVLLSANSLLPELSELPELPDAPYLVICALVLAALAWKLLSALFAPVVSDTTPSIDKVLREARQRASHFAQLPSREPRAVTVGHLLLQGLGPRLRARWIRASLPLAALLLVGIYMVPESHAHNLPAIRILVLLAAFGFQFTVAHSIAAVIYRSREEHALLRLAARLPTAAALNTVLGGSLLRQLGSWWAGSTAISAGLLFATGATPGELLRMLPIFCMTLIPAGFALRDYSRAHRARRWLAPAYFLAGLGMLFLSLLAFVNRKATVFWVGVSAAVALLVLASLWHGWRQMTRAPVALPAGRNA